MTPRELFAQIRDAFVRQDDTRLASLCNENLEEIVENFGSWLRVPEEIRSDRAAVDAWVQSLILIAQMFEGAGFPELMQQLSGRGNNPIDHWTSAFAKAHQLVKTGQYQEAVALLRSCVPEIHEASGDFVDEMRPKMYGLIGKALFAGADADEGKRFTQMALDDCRRVGDEEGVRAYSSNLRMMAASELGSSPKEGGGSLLETRITIGRAQELSDQAEFEKSNEMLLPLAGPNLSSPVLEFQGKIWGLLGLNFFRLSDFLQAQHFTQMAFDHCKKFQDSDGIRIYSVNLEYIATRLSQAQPNPS
jgi:hypothetical protein